MSIKFFTKSFSTTELVVSISIIIILSGMYFVNYRFQKNLIDLRDASNILIQKIRKTQNIAIAHTVLPLDCQPPLLPPSLGLNFQTGQSSFDIFADKDGQNDYNLGVADCSCVGDDECIERVFLPLTIEIRNIEIDTNFFNEGWVSFFLEDLSVKIRDMDPSPPSIQVELCIRDSACTGDSRKIVIINNKGMVELQD